MRYFLGSDSKKNGNINLRTLISLKRTMFRKLKPLENDNDYYILDDDYNIIKIDFKELYSIISKILKTNGVKRVDFDDAVRNETFRSCIVKDYPLFCFYGQFDTVDDKNDKFLKVNGLKLSNSMVKIFKESVFSVFDYYFVTKYSILIGDLYFNILDESTLLLHIPCLGGDYVTTHTLCCKIDLINKVVKLDDFSNIDYAKDLHDLNPDDSKMLYNLNQVINSEHYETLKEAVYGYVGSSKLTKLFLLGI